MKARARVSYRLSQSGAVILYVDGELTVRALYWLCTSSHTD
jgi:hypothetical protein